MGIAHILKTIKCSENMVVISDELLGRIQSDLIDIMRDVVEVCEEANIKWFLSGGSVLGAVRHHGFIPWDDDIDIFMERSDFEKFKFIFDDKLGKQYRLRLPGDRGYILNLPQIQKLGTKVQPIQSMKDSDEGLFIDIFILENTYNNLIGRYIHGIISTFYLFVDSTLRMEICKKQILECANSDKYVKYEIEKRAKFAWLFHYWSFEKWLKKSDKYFSHVTKRGKNLVCPSGAKHFFGEIFQSTLFDQPIKIQFENERWNVPNPPEKYLTIRFGGNYMELPNEKDRERHIYMKLDLGD